MGVLPFCDSGFLDGPRRSPSKNCSTNYHFRSYRFGISRHRSMEGPEPSGKVLWPCGLGGFLARLCSIGGDFHRFKRPPDGRRYGLEQMIPSYEYDVVVARACDCVRFMESECVFCVPLIVNQSELVYRNASVTATSGLDRQWTQASIPCF